MFISRTFSFKKNQHGFALVVVLITLLILAGVVASMLRGQTLKLKEAGAYFDMNDRSQVSHNAHRACLLTVKNAMESKAVGGFNWTQPIVMPDGVSVCTITAVNVPAALPSGAPVVWPQPNLIVETTSPAGSAGLIETSEILYPLCSALNVACVQSVAVITLNSVNNGIFVVSPWILRGGAVQIGWRGP